MYRTLDPLDACPYATPRDQRLGRNLHGQVSSCPLLPYCLDRLHQDADRSPPMRPSSNKPTRS